MAIKMLNDGRWICYYRRTDIDGVSRLKKDYFGRGPKAKAAAKKRNLELKLKKRRPVAERNGPTVTELAKVYISNKNFSANSAKHLSIRLTANILPFFGPKAAIDLVDQDIDNYIKKRRAAPIYNRAGKVMRIGVKDATIAREITDIQAILNWSKKRRPPLIAFNPVADYVKPDENLSIIPLITDDELGRIIYYAPSHLKRAIKICYFFGLRPGPVELFSLTWNNVDFKTGVMLVNSAHKGGPERRSVAIHDDLIDTFYRWYTEDDKRGPIIHWQGKAVKSIKKAWNTAKKRAGILRRIRFYDIRHAHISRVLMKGADVKAVSQIVGSRPETIWKNYQHVPQQLHRDTVAMLPALVD